MLIALEHFNVATSKPLAFWAPNIVLHLGLFEQPLDRTKPYTSTTHCTGVP